jgi:hypothetical protein
MLSPSITDKHDTISRNSYVLGDSPGASSVVDSTVLNKDIYDAGRGLARPISSVLAIYTKRAGGDKKAQKDEQFQFRWHRLILLLYSRFSERSSRAGNQFIADSPALSSP